MQFYLLPPERIDEWWPGVQPLVQKVLDYPLGMDLLDWWDVYSDCKNSKSMCLISEDWSYAAIMCVVTYPKAKVLDLYLCAGKDPSWEEMDKIVDTIAEMFQCKYVTITGRRGWEKVLKPLGYTFCNTTVMKEVQNVLDRNDENGEPGPTTG